MRVFKTLCMAAVCVPSVAACAQPVSNPLNGLVENFRAKNFVAAEIAIQGPISGSAYKSPSPRKTLAADQFISKVKPCNFTGVPHSTKDYAILLWNCSKPAIGDAGSAPMFVTVIAKADGQKVQLSDWCEETYDNRQFC